MAVVTLTSDFGTVDGYVGAMKGVIFSLAPDAVIVDITHAIPRHDIAAGAFALAQAAPQFPPGTIHLAVVDPGVGGRRAAVVVDSGNQLFVAPDNGLLSLVAPTPQHAYAISAAGFCSNTPSPTFHGRDVFAVAAGRLAAGAVAAQVGPKVSLVGAAPLPSPQPGVGYVVHVDGFGNLISNLVATGLPTMTRVQVVDEHIAGLSTSYQSVAVGALLAYIGSGNTLEIAVRDGSAAEQLNVGRGAVIYVTSAAEKST